MASPFQQQSLRRKLIYTLLIVALFSVTLVLRQASVYGIDARGEDLQIREHNLGEVELTGSAVRLLLTGSRGLAVCVLWQGAIEKQKKHEWNELELLVDSVTKLQPHFTTPWLFQSWNLSYNVSVESDRIRDKYFYITRGLELLAQGERQNTNNPDLRFWMGFYLQNKIGTSDETNTFRCLLEMSCMDPLKRDPNRFWTSDDRNNRVVDPAQFETFCLEHPRLVRRLRDGLKKDSPADIVDFLEENQKIPTRFQEKSNSGSGELATPLKPQDQQWPIMAPISADEERERADPDRNSIDCFVIARDWYTYSSRPLPPPEPATTGDTQPYDQRKYRMPHSIALSIFRGYPARGEAYSAENLDKDGWFDREGWKINGWFRDNKFRDGSDAVVGKDSDWASHVWINAFEKYQQYGISLGLYLTPEQIEGLNRKASAYRARYGVKPTDAGRQPPPGEMKEMGPGMLAHNQLYWYERFRQMTNFPHFYYTALVYSDPKTLGVRKAFFKAEEYRKSGDRELALETYEKAIPSWREILQSHKEFAEDESTRDDTFDIDLKYTELVRGLYGRRYKEYLVMADFLGQAASRPLGVAWYAPPASLVRGLPIPLVTPLDDRDKAGFLLYLPRDFVTNRTKLGYPTNSESYMSAKDLETMRAGAKNAPRFGGNLSIIQSKGAPGTPVQPRQLQPK
jgi:hypothetical protein